MFRLIFASVLILFPTVANSGITFMRLSEAVVQQRLKLKADSPEQKLAIICKQLELTHISGLNISEQQVPGEKLPNLIATIPGREPGIFVVAAPTGVTNSKAETNVQWGTLLMLPMLAESIASVPTRRTIVLIAFPNSKKDMLAGLKTWLQQLDSGKQGDVRAIVLLGQVGRTRTRFWVRKPDAVLVDWVQLAAVESMQPPLSGGIGSEWSTTVNSVPPFIQLWSSNEEGHTMRGLPFARTDIELQHYYNAYQLLCVLVLELDQRSGDDLKFPVSDDTSRAAEPNPAIESAELAEAHSLLKPLANAGFPNVQIVKFPGLRTAACSIARNSERLATGEDPWKNTELTEIHRELLKKRIGPKDRGKSEYELSDKGGERVYYALLDYTAHPGQVGERPLADIEELKKRSQREKFNISLLATGACAVPGSETSPKYWIVTLLAGPQQK